MRTFKVMCLKDGAFFKCTALEFEGKTWLAPTWSAAEKPGFQKPDLLIRIDLLERKPLAQGYGVEFLLMKPIPTAVLSGQSQHAAGVHYEVLEKPNLQVEVLALH